MLRPVLAGKRLKGTENQTQDLERADKTHNEHLDFSIAIGGANELDESR